jgi:enoyl-CoA hydratase
MSQDAVSYVVEDDIAIITIERPEVRNALNEAVVGGLQAAWRRFAEGDERAAVLAARGDHFSVGLDLKDPPPDMWRAVPGIGVDLVKPVICATRGWCVGGAMVLMQMSDLCVAATSTRFLYPEAKVGVTGGLIAGLAARVPPKIAMEIMLLGEPMDAARAYQVGLVNRVVPDGEEVDAAKAMARTIAMPRW